MNQILSNSETCVISEVLQHPIRCDMHTTSSGLEVTVTPKIQPQSTMPCHGGYDGTSTLEARISELERERDMAVGIAREAISMVPGNRGTVTTFEAVLDSICPQRQYEERDAKQDDDISLAARARRRADMNEQRLLRGELTRLWQIVSVMEGLLGYLIHDAAIRNANVNAQISRRDNRIAELSSEVKQKSRMPAVHENCNNPSRTGTMYAQDRRDFHANEMEKK